jgi:hypothetical protein
MRPLTALLTMLALGVCAPGGTAAVNPGDPAPNFTKNELISDPFPQAGPPRSLADYAGHVVVIHLLGYN